MRINSIKKTTKVRYNLSGECILYNNYTNRKSKGPSYWVFKAGSEVEFLISSGTLFQKWLALYALLSQAKVFVLGFWDSWRNFKENMR